MKTNGLIRVPDGDFRPMVRRIAEQRAALHADHASSRPLSKDYEYIGLLGEFVFGREFGLEVDVSLRPKGDDRVDFYTDIRSPFCEKGTIDVKTARKAYNLLREKDKRHAEILVLARYSDAEDWIALLGWEYERIIMTKCPVPRDFGKGIENHYVSAAALKPMSELQALLHADWLAGIGM